MSARISRAFLAAICSLAVPAAAAQCDALRWGDVPEAHLAMTAFSDDAEASAVILGDCGHEEVQLGGYEPKALLRRHARVKVLTEGGYDLGTVVLYYPEEGGSVRRVRGQTFVPTEGGEPRRVELNGDAIFENEAGNGVREVRFTLPALEPGAVFEFSYELVTNDFVNVGPWTFQSSEPTLYSEYRASVPARFGYTFISQGLADVEQSQDRRRYFDETFTDIRWVARDVPALRDEPYMTTLSDYEKRVELQLREYQWGSGFVDKFLTSWEEVAEVLLDHDRFGRQINGRDRDIRRQADELTEGLDSDYERATAIYDFVRTSMVWDGRSGYFLSDRADRVLEARRGDVADVNLVLLALLRAADVEADPVLLSTRPHGRVLTDYPLVTQFDRVVVLAQFEDEPLALLDATDPGRPFGMLPVEALSGTGFLVRSEPGWIDFQASVPTSTSSLVTGTLSADGTLDGTLTVRVSGYDAVAMRQRLREEASTPDAASDAAAQAADAGDDVDLTVTEVTGADDPDEPITVVADLTAPAAARVGETLYLSPFVLMGLEENPFKLQERTFPVDYAYPFTRTYAATLTLPEGAVPEELPPPLQMATAGGGARYVRTFATISGAIQVQARLQIIQTIVEPETYPALRRFYDEIVAAETEAIAIALSGGSPPAPAEPAAAAAEAPDAGPTTTDQQ